jgi:hypothetical protein
MLSCHHANPASCKQPLEPGSNHTAASSDDLLLLL